MRLRGRKDIREWLERQSALVVLEHEAHRGQWRRFFGNANPVHVELGMGKGRFITEMSLKYPAINFIGVDLYDVLVGRAAELYYRKLRVEGLGEPRNLALLRMNVERIEEAFAGGEIERIYLNFSDPWPKARHAKRRLTHPRFLEKYKALLNERGEIHLKTDSASLFEFSLNSFADLGLRMRHISLDLHRDGPHPDLVMTEYESKFFNRGVNIYRCEAIVGKEAPAKHGENEGK